jgi:hypothetical protein
MGSGIQIPTVLVYTLGENLTFCVCLIPWLFGQIFADEFQVLFQLQVAVGVEPGIVSAVVELVEITKIGPGQI